jgi:uncharacterized membrane protein YccC
LEVVPSTEAPPSQADAVALPSRRQRLGAWRDEAVDRLAGSDPGLNRLRAAAQAVVSVAAIIAAEYGFVKLTGALQTGVPEGATPRVAATIAAGNHALLVIGILLGAMIGMIASIGVNDTTARRQVVSTLILPVPILASMVLGLALGGHRVAALTSFPVILALGTLARRWGPRGLLIGMPLFIGDFIGFFLYGVVHLGDLGWIAAELGLAALVSVAVRLALFAPDPTAALHRSQRSWAARAAKVADLADLAFSAVPGSDATAVHTKLRRNLVRLNEAALIIDAQLAEPAALAEGSSAQRLHERLFDAELGLTNAARFAAALHGVALDEIERQQVSVTLAALRAGDLPAGAIGAADILTRLGATAADDLGAIGSPLDAERRHRRILLHRFAGSVTLLADALDEWMAIGAEVRADDEEVFTPAVALAGGWLPGSALVSARVSSLRGRRRDERIALPPWLRAAIQVGVAVGAATAIGDVVSGRRFYWAVIAAFVSFIGVNNNVEQVRKALQRVVGTVVGIIVGSLVAQLDGHSAAAAIVVILIAMFFSVYLIRISYAFMVVGVTVMVAQLYEQLGEFSNSLLLLRLGETALGSAVAVVTVLVVVPLRTERVLGVALTDLLHSTREFLAEAIHRLADPAASGSLALLARAVDSDYQTLVTTARPLRRFGDAGRWAGRMVSASTGLRHYARNLARDVPRSTAAAPVDQPLLEHAGADLLRSIDVLIDGYDGGPKATFVRSASEWNVLEQRTLERVRRTVTERPATALAEAVDLIMVTRDLQLLDGALAELAHLGGITVTDLDTAPSHTAAARRSAAAPFPVPRASAP